MSNLLNLRCTMCTATDSIDILAAVWVRVTDDGTDADLAHDGSHEYTLESTATCAACGQQATVADFKSRKGSAS